MSEYAVFLSHNSRDKPLVEGLAHRLAAEGLPPWLDRWHLTPGGKWQDEIAAALAASGACAVFLGGNGLGDWVQEELALALDRAAKDRDFRVFLVLLPGLSEPFDIATVPPFLRTRTWVDLRPGLDDPDALGTFMQAVTGRRAGPQARATPSAAVRAESVARLPSPPSPLIGREREIAAIATCLREPTVRLVTLSGPGGIGKTRLALAAAAVLIDAFADGVMFVPLAALTDPELVLPGIAGALGVPPVGGRTVIESVAAAVRDRELLLVLDNFEQLLDAAPALADLLAACPGLKALVTSRAALQLRGEHEISVPPLGVPNIGQQPDVGVLGASEAVRLFVERAREIRPAFALTADNAAAVAAICARLDGVPLAIELAAARTRLLDPRALLARLDHSLTVLASGARDLPARQRTLRDTIAWSHGLLGDRERALFARLAVFSGGWTLEAATAICETAGEREPDLLEVMESLIAQSMVRRSDGPGSEPRFGMLGTIHEYSVEQLEASGAGEMLRARHAAYFTAWAEDAAPRLIGPQQTAWMECLEAEHDNLRAVLQWSTERAEAETALRLGGALWWFWATHGHLGEGRRWLATALALEAAAPPGVRAQALDGAGTLARRQGDHAAAGALHGEALAIYRALGDRDGVGAALAQLSEVAHARGDLALARAQLEESLALARGLGNQRGVAACLNNLGEVARSRGDFEAARHLHDESLAIFRALGYRGGVASCLNNLAETARNRGDYEAARPLYAEALRLWRSLGDRQGVALALTNAGTLACVEGQNIRAAHLLGAAEALREQIGAPPPPVGGAERERLVDRARSALGAGGWDAAWVTGRALPLETAIALAVASDGQHAPEGTVAVGPGGA